MEAGLAPQVAWTEAEWTPQVAWMEAEWTPKAASMVGESNHAGLRVDERKGEPGVTKGTGWSMDRSGFVRRALEGFCWLLAPPLVKSLHLHRSRPHAPSRG